MFILNWIINVYFTAPDSTNGPCEYRGSFVICAHYLCVFFTPFFYPFSLFCALHFITKSKKNNIFCTFFFYCRHNMCTYKLFAVIWPFYSQLFARIYHLLFFTVTLTLHNYLVFLFFHKKKIKKNLITITQLWTLSHIILIHCVWKSSLKHQHYDACLLVLVVLVFQWWWWWWYRHHLMLLVAVFIFIASHLFHSRPFVNTSTSFSLMSTSTPESVNV